ncbi:MAG: winged helix-turn-helix domain-containing protein [Candidatus Bathyarchaeia archaeon]
MAVEKGLGMNRRRRSEVQILMDILSLCLKDVKVTQIMYRANLSYSTMRKYLDAALKRGLIIKVKNDDGGISYHITEKGKILLETLKEVRHALSR